MPGKPTFLTSFCLLSGWFVPFLFCLWADTKWWRLLLLLLSFFFFFFFLFQCQLSVSCCWSFTRVAKKPGLSFFTAPTIETFRFDLTRSPRGSQCTDKECPSAPPRPREVQMAAGLVEAVGNGIAIFLLLRFNSNKNKWLQTCLRHYVFASICISTVFCHFSVCIGCVCPSTCFFCLFWLQCCFFRAAVVMVVTFVCHFDSPFFLKENQSWFGCWWQSCFDILIYVCISRLVPLLLLACCGLLVQRSVVLIHLSPQLSPFWFRCCLARCLLVAPDKHSMFKQWLFGLFGLFGLSGVYGVILVNIFLPSGHIPKNVIYSQKNVHQVGCSNLQHDSFPNTWTSRAKSYWKKRLKHTKTASKTNVRLLYIWTSCLLSSAWSMRRPVMLPVTMVFSDSSWGDSIVALVSVSLFHGKNTTS